MRSALAFFAILTLVGCPSTGGDTSWLYVDHEAGGAGDGSAASPFSTIGEALAAAEDGAGIRIAPGAYPEALDFAVRTVSLVGDGGVASIGDGTSTALTLSTGAQLSGTNLSLAGVDVAFAGLTLVDSELHPAGGSPLVGDGADVTLIDVTITHEGGGAMALTGGTLTVDGATTHDMTGTAIALTDVQAIIEGLSLDSVVAPDGGGIGVEAIGGRLLVRDSDFTRVGMRAIRIEAGQADVQDSSFTKNGLTAIAFSTDAEGLPSFGFVSGCEFDDNDTDVMVSGSDATVINNHFVASRVFAVVASYGATVRVDRNHFEDLLGTGVTLIAAMPSTITNNVIDGAGEGGIGIQQSAAQAIVAWNEIRNVHASGISISWAANMIVAYNVISDVQLDQAFNTLGEGISLMDVEGDTYGNEITDVAGIGINLNRADGTVFENTVVGGLKGGIQSSGVGMDPPLTITGNVSEQNIGFGVLVMEGDVVITDNTLRWSDYNLDGFGDGVALMSDTTAVVEGNLCQGNQSNGIMAIDNVVAEIDGNELVDNDTYGIWAHCENEGGGIRASQVTLGEANTYTENRLGETHGCFWDGH
jgi:hypothetical protein